MQRKPQASPLLIALMASASVFAMDSRVYSLEIPGAPAPRGSNQMNEDDFAAIVRAEERRLRKNAKRARAAERARLGAAIARHVSPRERFEMAEAARRAKSTGGLAR